MSTKPGATAQPEASSSRAPEPRRSPISAIMPSATATSATRPGAPVPSNTVPPRTTRSTVIDRHRRSCLLDPELGHRVDAVPFEDRVDLGEVGAVDRPPECADVVLDLADGAAPHERGAHGRMRRGPAQRELRDALVVARRERLELLDRADVVREPVGAEEGGEHLDRAHVPLSRPPVLPTELDVLGERPGQQAVRERSVRHEPDAVLRAIREDVALHPPVEHVEPVLHDVDTPDRHARLDLLELEVREADEADLALAHDVVERAHRLLERREAVGPVHEVHVDVVGAEVLQALVDRREHARTAAVPEVWLVAVVHAELRDDEGLVATPPQRLTEGLLGRAHAVPLGGVEAVDPEVERAADGPLELGRRDVAVASADLPAPVPDGRDVEARTTERAELHAWLAACVHRCPPPAPDDVQRDGLQLTVVSFVHDDARHRAVVVIMARCVD